MMQRNAIEPVLGALVLVAAGAFLYFAHEKAGQRSFEGYPLTAQFSAVDGLQQGSDVRIGGVKVGQVTSIAIDPKTYLAMVTLSVDPKVQIPSDSVASVSTEGLLGGKFLGLLPGGADDMLKPGARITHTEASVSFESLLGQVIYSMQSSGGSKDGGSAAQPETAAPAPGQNPPPKHP